MKKSRLEKESHTLINSAQSSAASADLSARIAALLTDTSATNAKEQTNTGLGKYRPPVPREVYLAEKDIGARDERTSTLKLRRLRPIHKRILALHLACWSNTSIARHLGLSAVGVSRIILDPLSQEVIHKQDDIIDQEFARLKILSNQVLREGMSDEQPISIRLKSANLHDKRESHMVDASNATAEDVMAHILDNIHAEKVTINLIGQQNNQQVNNSGQNGSDNAEG